MASFLILKSTVEALRKDKRKETKTSFFRKCRVCNGNQGNVPIFDEVLETNLAEDIRNFSGVTITQADRFSKHMCQQCLDLLNNCLLFKDLCIKTDKLLNEGPKVVKKRITSHKKKHPKEICNWRCSYCPVLFRDLKSYYGHLPQCDIEHSTSGQSSPPRNCNEQMNYEPEDDIIPPDDSSDDDPLIDLCRKSEPVQDDETKDLSDDSYSVPSPTFSDANGVRCPSCQRFFTDSQSYNKHLSYSKACKAYSNQNKEDTKPEPKPKGNPKALCEICGKTVSRPTIVAHKRLHKNIFPYACDACPYRGRTKNLLVVHMRSHMTVKPYKCNICSKTMISTSNLTRHMETNHGDGDKTTCKCPECGKEFRYMQSMKEHVANVHRDQPRVECDICFKTFRPKHLNRHRRKVHKLNIPKSDMPSNRLPSYIKCMMEESFDNEHDDLGPETSRNSTLKYENITK